MSSVPERVAAPALNQFSVYQLRGDVTEYDQALRDADALEQHPVAPASGLEGRLYVQPARASEPRWLPFLTAVVGHSLGEHRNSVVSAVLVVRRSDRLYALTFGFGRMLLDPDVIEPDFGLKVAAGLVDAESVNAVDSRVLEATRIQVRRQASRGATTQAIGLDVGREMLRALSGRLLDESLGTRVTGADSLGVAARLTPSSLASRLDVFDDAFARRRYRERFAHLDRWHAITDSPTIRALDDELLDAIARRDERVTIAVPEVTAWTGAGFRFDGEDREAVHPFPELSDYLAVRDGAPTLAQLRRDRLHEVSTEADLPSGAWSVYRSLEWDHRQDERVYVLAEGRWWVIDADYLAGIDRRLAALERTPIDRPPIDPREWEVDYNRRFATHVAGRALLDVKFAHFQDESGKVEICDVFTEDRQFIHVKPEAPSSTLSHLFAQGAVSADLFRHVPAYRERTRELLSSYPALADTIPSERPEPYEFEVAFAVVSKDPDEVPLDLPVFSRIHLSRIVETIDRLDYRVRVFGIPIEVGARPAALGPTEPEKRLAKARAGGTETSIG